MQPPTFEIIAQTTDGNSRHNGMQHYVGINHEGLWWGAFLGGNDKLTHRAKNRRVRAGRSALRGNSEEEGELKAGLKEYYEIVDEARTLSVFCPTHMLIFCYGKVFSNHET